MKPEGAVGDKLKGGEDVLGGRQEGMVEEMF
jgi:hypothetical protein